MDRHLSIVICIFIDWVLRVFAKFLPRFRAARPGSGRVTPSDTAAGTPPTAQISL